MSPRFVVHEHFSGGGLAGSPLPPSFAREGLAMLRTLARDFASLGETLVPLDPRAFAHLAAGERSARSRQTTPRERSVHPEALGGARAVLVSSAAELESTLAEHVPRADWTLTIAPETGGCLQNALRRVASLGGRALGGSSEAVEISTDKLRTARYLAASGVPALPAWIDDGALRHFDVVAKPRDGAGSEGIRVRRAGVTRDAEVEGGQMILTPLLDGIDASVVVIAGAAGVASLEPTRQLIDRRGFFAYLGGELPLHEPLAGRARDLAEAAVRSLPSPLGFFGVDLLLDVKGVTDVAGGRDLVVEINPRATTSLCALRAALERSIAAPLLACAEGEPPSRLRARRALRFRADGTMENEAAEREIALEPIPRPPLASASCEAGMLRRARSTIDSVRSPRSRSLPPGLSLGLGPAMGFWDKLL